MYFNKTKNIKKILITITILIIALIILIKIINLNNNQNSKMDTSRNKKALLIIAPDKFRDEELFHTKEMLEKNNIKVDIASKKTGIINGSRGSSILVKLNVKDINISSYNAIIFIGGPGTSVYLDDKEIQDIAIKAKEENKTIGAICLAPSILANSGLLNNTKATAFSSEENNLKEHNAIWENKDVVQDKNIITGNGPNAAYKFGETLSKEILKN